LVEVVEEMVAIAGATLWTARQGAGPAVLLCHGGPGLWDYLGPVASMIADRATVYRFDQRACGRSPGDPPFTLHTAIADVEALRRHWGIDRWVVMGHSYGATLALAYSLTHPERALGLGYLSGVGIDPAWHEAFRANLRARLTPEEQALLATYRMRLAEATGDEWAAASRANCELSWSAEVMDRSHARELARTLFVGDLQPNYALNRILGDDADRFAEDPATWARIAQLQVPTLVLHGEADPRPAWSAQHLAALLPNAREEILPGVGHLIWLDAPDRIGSLLRQFLGDLGPAA
jgi:proline iminopeptidase